MATPNLGFQNFFTTTLASGITASDTTIYLNSLPTPSEGYLVIEPDSSTNKEIIYYTSKGANFVTLPSVAAGRGVGGTTAVSHSSGVTVQMNVVAEHFEALQDGTAFAVGGIGASAYADGWAPILGSTPNTVTYNGNRNYDLVFNSVDLSSTLSPGQKLKLTRTVAAPSQCTDLESGSSQYYSRASASVAGMTFTDDFVVSAWVKLESYTSGNACIASRFSGTNGWILSVAADGRIQLLGQSGAGNTSYVISYASVPLNKWVHITAQLDMSAFTATTTTSYVMFDGVDVAAQVARTGTNPTSLTQGGNLEIGSYNVSSYFDGKLAQVAIFNAKVTQATMRTYMSQGLSGSESSLISAYSFDNSINDLNTTNANNLTANGSAVATNADSPFANAVSAGLQEYAEINSVTFSTNTTVNVRVPDTCMIPTSGGISNVYYAVGATPTGLPAFSNILAMTILGVNFTSTSNSRIEVTGAKITVTVPAYRAIKLSAFTRSISGTGSDVISFEIHDGSVSSTTNMVAGADNGINASGTGPSAYIETIERPNATTTHASKTYVIGCINNTAARSFTLGADLTATYRRPLFIKAELI